MLKLLKDCKKYSVNTYASVEISLNTCRNTLDFMCDLELFSKIRSPLILNGSFQMHSECEPTIVTDQVATNSYM